MKPRGGQSSKAGDFLLTAFPARKVVQYNRGDTIFSQGENCTDVHYVRQGAVKLAVVSKRGKGAVLAILGHGDFFGEECLAGQTAHMTSAIALVSSSIVIVKRRTMLRLLHQEPAVSARFITHLLARNLRIQRDLIDHLFHPSEKRLARTLLLLAHGEEGKVRLELEKISQDTLAEMIGTTRSRVNFFMNKFRRLGFIEYNGGLQVRRSLLRVLRD